MTTINLREFYPWYIEDQFIEISGEVAKALRSDKRYEAAHRRRVKRSKAQYSLSLCMMGLSIQQIVIHYSRIGIFTVPDREDIPQVDVLLETRKDVAVSYEPARIA